MRSMPTPERLSPSARDSAAAPVGAGLRSQGATHLGLARLAPRWFLSASTRDLYRHVARLVELGPESEFLLTPSGGGMAVQYLAETTKSAAAGVDPSPELVEAAVAHAREAHLAGRIHYEAASPDDLPYQDAVFDVTIGEVGLGAMVDLSAGIRELVRVTRPLGVVVLIQFTWTGTADPARRAEVARVLGVWPHLLVECKQMLRDAGVVDLYVEDWTDTGGGRQQGTASALAQVGSFRDRALLLWRAWRAWGWPGVRLALYSRGVIHDLIARERVLALSVIKGIRWRGGAEG